MKREKLDQAELDNRLPDLTGWTVREAKLFKRFEFANFAESLAFVNQVGILAEKADHHPDITFGWGYAEFAITTHDRGGITEHDLALASNIDALS